MTAPQRGLAVALLLSGALIATRELQYFTVAYDRFHLPAFDGHVYVAMAESPGVFTVAPWGYRILNPWLVRLFTWPLRDHSPAFFWSTVLGLSLGGVLLFVYLRRLGHAVLPALLGLTLFGASGPPGEVVRYQFLAEPLTFLLEMAFLLGLEAAAPAGLLALIAVLGVLSKEFFVFLLPLVWLVGRERDGDRKALLRTGIILVPALLLTVTLRHVWTPHIRPPLPSLSLDTFALAQARLVGSWTEWRADTLLMGLTPLAIVGAFRRRGRRLAARGAYLALVAIVPPFLNPVTFFSDDIPRLLLYALPAAVPLALAALDGLLPRDANPETQRVTWRPSVGLVAGGLALVTCLAPFTVIDDYRRVDLQGTRDATVMLAVFRGSLEAASALDAREPFTFDSRTGRYSEGLSKRHNLSDLRRVRWFLRNGWGASASRQGGEPRMAEGEAHLLLPCLRPRDLEGALRLSAAAETRLAVTVNGRPVADLLVGVEARDFTVRIPAETLFRGDNDLSLAAVGVSEARVGLERFTFRAM
jgi:hypothetical protein